MTPWDQFWAIMYANYTIWEIVELDRMLTTERPA